MVSPGYGIRLAVAVVTCALIAPASAHHSRAAFDTTVEVTIEGVVKNVVWANPHVYMTLEVAGPAGSPRLRRSRWPTLLAAAARPDPGRSCHGRPRYSAR